MSDEERYIVEMDDINRIFRKAGVVTTALSSVSLRVKRGEFCAIMGPSGCGKSTLLSIMGLLDSPTSGRYDFMSSPVTQLREKDLARIRQRHIGFVFQNFNLIDRLNVWRNVALPISHSLFVNSEAKKKALAMLSLVGVENRANHYPDQLSGGQQQRVAIARALICDGDLIIADEPTGNLDSESGQKILELLAELRKLGKTIIMVTHSDSDAKAASRVIRMLDGRFV